MAAGRGERAGSPQEGPKQYRKIGNDAVIKHTIFPFLSHPDISKVVLVIHPDDEALCKAAIGETAGRVELVHGGPTRQASTLNGLRALQDNPPHYVHIHDGARPFLTKQCLDSIHVAFNKNEGILLALPISDTVKRVNADRLVLETIPRAGLYGAQTPQSFPYPLILNAHEAAAKSGRDDFTDDSSIAEWANIPMRIIEGSSDNIKITWNADLIKADRLLQKGAFMFTDIRTGNGYDVHHFAPGDHVTLCGVDIAHKKKLSGHSDADVALHALTDALLATRGAGDIGTHFPPSDPQWAGAASSIFVRHAVKIIKDAGGRIINVDITLIAEAPKIGPHREAMVAALQDMLAISADRISIKATTNEKLGFVGREEGIAAIATANVIYPGEVPA